MTFNLISFTQIRAARDAAAAEVVAAAAAEGAHVNAEELNVDLPEARPGHIAIGNRQLDMPANIPGKPFAFPSVIRALHIADQLSSEANRLAALLPNEVDIQPILQLYARLRQLRQERADRADQIPAVQHHANIDLYFYNRRIRQHEENIARMINAALAGARPGTRKSMFYSMLNSIRLSNSYRAFIAPLPLAAIVPPAGPEARPAVPVIPARAAIDPAARIIAPLAAQGARKGGGRR